MPAADLDPGRCEERPRAHERYAGIGSRQTPDDVLAAMQSAASALARRGWHLRTGASPGADQAFYRGARAAGGEIELYLPWPGFEASSWADADPERIRVLARPSARAYELAARFHPGWEDVAADQRQLLARDAHEVLGADLRTPAALVLCWTADGTLDGSGEEPDGTRQALRIAHHEGIAVFNLARGEHMLRLARLAPGGAPRST